MNTHFDVQDVEAVQGMPDAILDRYEEELVSLVTQGRRIHPPEVYRSRADNLAARISALPPIVQLLLRSRFDMGAGA